MASAGNNRYAPVGNRTGLFVHCKADSQVAPSEDPIIRIVICIGNDLNKTGSL
jgi:hypothetical protein